MDKWKTDAWPPANQCNSVLRGGVSMTAIVSVTDMQGSFFILMIGCVIACIVLAWEVLYTNKKNKSDNSVKSFTP